ncbi:zinc finger protein 644 isoform X2 [Triplophysa rosa]|nr:zinc finger protein 644 isoform X2 [Triplophysa rosa]XP_057193335.1 zinc finger protein 644 isoform X2 [Triplophysa rosa]XP_057193336.1 zinc finger protein 644 isoform X2 [Triplophysa rosa]XP_057193337.1 zinc finger protein 644 isoform X2 [Triplophysa rosa]XP_057193338.1 zinc finger protein 644 isoform X2 [Triplophysa rosa]
MAAMKESAEEDKEVESSSYDIQDLTSTSSSSNNNNNNSLDPPEPLPLDSHQNPLNGVQSNPFVCGSIPAAPSTNDSLPSRALVNGAASHCTSEEPRVHNKDMSPLPGTDTSPEVLPPPSELQSDTRQKTEGCVLKVQHTRASSESNNSDGEAPLDVLVEEGLDNRPISRLLARKQIKAGCLWDFDSELSESSSDDCDGLNWGLQEKFMQLLLKSRIAGGGVRKNIAGAPPANQKQGMRKTHTMESAATRGQVYDGFDYASQNSLTDEDSDFNSSISKEHAFRKEPESLKAYAGLRLEKFCDKAAAMKELISSEKEERCDEGRSDIETNTYMGEKLSLFKTETKPGKELSFFPCSKCNANFKEKMHLHRHMMYHLDRNNKVKQEYVPRPFICRECGRSFRDLNSLQKHMVIHQVQRERLMEEIKSFGKIDVEGRRACIQCVFETKCPQTFVRHGKTNEKERHCNSSEGHDHMTTSETQLMTHEFTAHHSTCDKSRDLLICQICTFKTNSKDAFRKHMELIHGQQYYDYNEPHSNMDDIKTVPDRLADQTKTNDSSLLSLTPKTQSKQMWSVTEKGELALRPNGSADLNVRSKETQKACDGFCSSLIKWSPGSQANKLSPFSLRSDKPSKLSPLPTEKIDVTTGLPYVEEDNQEYESTVTEKRTKSLSSFDVHLTTKAEIVSKASCLNSDTESSPKDPSSSSTLAPQTLKHKIPSKRKMSIPYRNTHVNIPHARFANCEPESPQWESNQLQDESYYDGAQAYSNFTKESPDQFRSNTHSDYFISGQTSPFKNNITDNATQSNLDIDDDEICTLIIKEECIESIISEDTPDPAVYEQSDPYAGYVVPSLSLVGRKCCPYCPAVFESGVGLSNHVRGHLHRVGLSYEARHLVSPEQVASQDRKPRIRRKIPTVNRRIRKDEPESKTEHTCPLCLGWFDTKTGLSNHVRGHLKRIGKPISGSSKSPLCILTELLQDEMEYKNILKVLGARPHFSKHFVSQKFASSDGLFLTSTGIPVKIQHGTGTEGQWAQIRPPRDNMEKNSADKIQSSAFEDLLENRKLEQKMKIVGDLKEARAPLSISYTSGSTPDTPYVKLDPTWNQEKFAVNKKICIHCNATFHSGVSLSNHLRAYARRKRIALLEGTTYDCKQKRPRSRPGPKRKMFSSSHAATEVIYRMTCRFCDLTFQGPQSVQEDWIKHLQRHLMHTSIPGMGTGMVEVSAMCKELCSPTPPERLLLDTHPPLSLTEGVS